MSANFWWNRGHFSAFLGCDEKGSPYERLDGRSHSLLYWITMTETITESLLRDPLLSAESLTLFQLAHGKVLEHSACAEGQVVAFGRLYCMKVMNELVTTICNDDLVSWDRKQWSMVLDRFLLIDHLVNRQDAKQYVVGVDMSIIEDATPRTRPDSLEGPYRETVRWIELHMALSPVRSALEHAIDTGINPEIPSGEIKDILQVIASVDISPLLISKIKKLFPSRYCPFSGKTFKVAGLDIVQKVLREDYWLRTFHVKKIVCAFVSACYGERFGFTEVPSIPSCPIDSGRNDSSEDEEMPVRDARKKKRTSDFLPPAFVQVPVGVQAASFAPAEVGASEHVEVAVCSDSFNDGHFLDKEVSQPAKGSYAEDGAAFPGNSNDKEEAQPAMMPPDNGESFPLSESTDKYLNQLFVGPSADDGAALPSEFIDKDMDHPVEGPSDVDETIPPTDSSTHDEEFPLEPSDHDFVCIAGGSRRPIAVSVERIQDEANFDEEEPTSSLFSEQLEQPEATMGGARSNERARRISNSKWTKEEDLLLCEGLTMFGEGNWKSIKRLFSDGRFEPM